jgi:hypothetical protein
MMYAAPGDSVFIICFMTLDVLSNGIILCELH